MNKKLGFLKELSYKTYKLKGNKPFSLYQLIESRSLVDKYQQEIDNLIQTGFFFLEKVDNKKYKKTYRIPEICNRTIKELEKEKINTKILKMLNKYPLLLHIEFERWLNTKHKSMLSYVIDKYWHNFMLYSYEYNSWCNDNFGYIVHHIPTPDYENKDLKAEDIIIDHAEYFAEYRKIYPISKSILLYNLPYKLLENNIKFKKIKNIIFDLISELSFNQYSITKIDKDKIFSILDDVKNAIKSKGYIVLKHLSLDEYQYLNKQLGTVINITNITINKNSNRKFNSYKAMPLHTDAHDVDLVSWYCQEQDLEDGTIILKSLRNFKNFFDENEIKKMKDIKIRYPIYKRFYTGEYPLLKNENFYYAPWLEKKDYNKEQLKILNKFKLFVESQEEIRIRLEKGNVLIIDNMTILHGRDEILENSKRLLYRTHLSL